MMKTILQTLENKSFLHDFFLKSQTKECCSCNYQSKDVKVDVEKNVTLCWLMQQKAKIECLDKQESLKTTKQYPIVDLDPIHRDIDVSTLVKLHHIADCMKSINTNPVKLKKFV